MVESFRRRSRRNHGGERHAFLVSVLLDLQGSRKRVVRFFFVKGDDAKRVLAVALDLVNRDGMSARVASNFSRSLRVWPLTLPEAQRGR